MASSLLSNQLAITLFSSIVAPNDNDNTLFSPMSISSALALVAAGSKGKTSDEIAKVVGWESNIEGLAEAMFSEVKKTTSQCIDPCIIKSANGLWVAKEFEVAKEYADTVKKFEAIVSETDFKSDNSGSRKLINKWVEEQTNEKIKDLFPDGVFNSLTKAVIVNALYFKGIWLKPFDKTMTQTTAFHVSSNKKVDVPLMYHSGEFKYLYDDERKCDIVKLDYSSSSFSMIVIVPHEMDGLKQVSSDLTAAQFSKWMNDLEASGKETVDVFIPRFKVTKKLNLKEHLSQTGIKEMFTDRADLSGISKRDDLYVSSAFHQAFIEVNEEGTEAAAATGMEIMAMSLPPQVRADHPFMFMIVENDTKNIIFIGRVVDPTA